MDKSDSNLFGNYRVCKKRTYFRPEGFDVDFEDEALGFALLEGAISNGLLKVGIVVKKSKGFGRASRNSGAVRPVR
jgi:hypothetical protein